ncbi:d309e00e-7586-4388-9614-1a2147733b27 [Sclerotinia trifoliorum]|uniref:D309e00e-7586-4388-9614-1a2147733b27 n=1 Tax=Sclerotinia trifoliorum TaxID=28548 RepID=A0A8H2VTP0_9HELO|nr:d309e00e-7586-4388-9614-1a2147733b27 [Sclerotinia trifoliorum]
MAYNDEAVLAKLSALNETQESIVTVAQWIMFHRRYADRTGQLWLQKLKDSGSNKRLNLVYLANEVAQQSKARRKDDFLIAFSPVIAEATATAYKGATSDVQNKLKRVVEVWRQRQIFEIPIQDAVEARIEELEKSRSSNRKGLGGSLFSSNSSSAPSELQPLVAPQQTISKLVLSTKTATNSANSDYEKLTDPNTPTPSAPVHAARLNGLLKTLANAEGAVAEVIKSRNLLIEGLEKLLETNRNALAEEKAQLNLLSTRRTEIDTKKREVEDSIMRGFANSSESTPADGSPGNQMATPKSEPDRPEVEPLSPPLRPMKEESIQQEPLPDFDLNASAGVTNGSIYASQSMSPTSGLDLLSSVSTSYGRSNSLGNLKKRKLNDDFPEMGGDAMEGLDADVAEMLRQDTGAA